MRLCSIDVFDTVLTRDVAEPTDLFLVVAHRLREQLPPSETPQAFVLRRMDVERRARGRTEGQEPNLTEIYGELRSEFGWSAEQAETAARVEMDAEAASLRLVPGILDHLEHLRNESDRLVFASDMYLPDGFIEEILRREGAFREGDRLYVSNEWRASKCSGKLFEIIRRDFPKVKSWRHVGDNPTPDFTVPRSLGINATLILRPHLSRWERFLRGPKTRPASLETSRLVAAMRIARLGRGADDNILWNLGTNIAGPLLFGFVSWVLEQAVAQKIERVYFVSRDGEILLKIARQLCERWKLPLDCRYLYGSRQAWHGSALTELEERDREWLFESDEPLSLKAIAGRLNVDPTSLATEMTRRDPQFPLSAPLDSAQRDELWNALREAPLAAMLGQVAKRAREQVVGYLGQSGFLDPCTKAFVDIGWRGNLQKSLQRLLAAEGLQIPFVGLYFGFARRLSPEEVSLRSYWQDARGAAFPPHRARLMEVLTSGHEGSVMGYELRAGHHSALLNRPTHTEAISWGLPLFQDAIVAFASEAASLLSLEDIRRENLRSLTTELFLEFCHNPSPEEAACLGRFPHASDQLETQFITMVDADLPVADMMRIAWGKNAWHRHPWPEAQIALRPHPLLLLARQLRRKKKRLTDVLAGYFNRPTS